MSELEVHRTCGSAEPPNREVGSAEPPNLFCFKLRQHHHNTKCVCSLFQHFPNSSIFSPCLIPLLFRRSWHCYDGGTGASLLARGDSLEKESSVSLNPPSLQSTVELPFAVYSKKKRFSSAEPVRPNLKFLGSVHL